MERISELELKKSIDIHKIWSDSTGKVGVRLYLYNMDLSGLDLSDLDLIEAAMEEVNFTKTKFVNTILHGAHLVLSIFDYADLTNVKIRKANMNKTSCSNALFNNCAALRTTFYGANLKGANFTNAELISSSFDNANLEACIFNNANLKGIDFNGARLYNASFKGATGLENIYDNQCIDIGPEGSPIILKGEEMKKWLREQATI